MIIPVPSADDPRLALYAAVRERDLARRDGVFIVEGQIALEKLAASRFRTQSILLSDNRVEPLEQILEKFDPAIPIYVAPQAEMDVVTGFHIHRGVLAVAERGDEILASELIARLPASSTVVVLVGLANHDNVGACFRNAAALGAGAVLLDATSCDPLYRKAIRVSSGTVLQLPFSHAGDGASLIAALQAAGFEAWSLSPTNGEPLHTIEPPPRLAIVLGPEGPGLPDDLLGSGTRVTIPMAAGVDSLNVATAGAVALAHVFARRG